MDSAILLGRLSKADKSTGHKLCRSFNARRCSEARYWAAPDTVNAPRAAIGVVARSLYWSRYGAGASAIARAAIGVVLIDLRSGQGYDAGASATALYFRASQ